MIMSTLWPSYNVLETVEGMHILSSEESDDKIYLHKIST